MATDQVLTGSAPPRSSTAPPRESSVPIHGNTPAAAQQRPRTVRVDSLTGLRFPAALLVFAHHAFLGIPPLRLLADEGTENRLAHWSAGSS
ncbi:hypothetical protein OTB20_08935 [Streptomyces sp. H27-H1]|uniref:hypothetical protein n=1 Tax=Streptomyces sp. H27-H1 TaxID=2996461 RepID=UPI0022706DE2|nr:hypothetical protein [Streptomyces sp. H27-H1]MCY0926329.1 hypothetical protein [Streptomyces sp. H27-H1]